MYAPLWSGLKQGLIDVFENGFYADKVIQHQFKANRQWGSHDRRLYAEALYDIVRWWRRLLFLVDVPWPESETWSRAEREVYDAVIQAWCTLNEVEIDPKVRKCELPKTQALREAWDDRSLPRAVRESLPDWLDAWAVGGLGEERWDEALSTLNTVAPVYLRANRLKTSAKELLAQLRSEKIEARTVGDEAGEALFLPKRANVFITKAFKEGLFEMQDLHSQYVARMLDPQPGERVIDACAGAGGKSLHLAALMKNKGKVIALDTLPKKLVKLRERATRAGATCIETRDIDSTKVIKRLADSADRLLLDVPCSGLGVIRRNPDAKWKLTRAEVDRLGQLQREILSSYTSMLKANGTLVYATCSIHPEENEKQVQTFLSQSETGRWELEAQETLWPEADGPDGFFYARLKRLS